MVLSYNHPELTARAVQSALQVHDKVFLIHNGSESKFYQILSEKFKTVTHLSLQQNRGYSGGVNFGLNKAFKNLDWLVLLTNDCQIQNLPKLPDAPAFVAPHIRIQKSLRTDSLGGGFKPHFAKIFHCKNFRDFETSKYKYIPGSAFLIHKDVYYATGDFDESLGTYWEDVDFSQRALKKNQKLLIDPDWLVEHGRGKTCHKDRHYTLYLYQRNRKRISLKYTPTFYKPLLFIVLWTTWTKAAFKLWRNSRAKDVRLLLRAISD